MPDTFAATLTAAVAASVAQAGEAMHAFVVDVAAPMTQDRVPVATGALRDSMAVSDPVVDGDTVSVVLSYGNPDDDTGVYAIVVHERTDLAHATGQSKYVESVVAEVTPTFVQEIVSRMRG